MRTLAFVFALLLLTINGFAQTLSSSIGTSRSIPGNYWGVAGQNIIRDNISWATPGLLKKLPQLNATLIRYPGGDIANFWDWREGWFLPSDYFKKNYDKLTRGPNKPEDFKVALDLTGATPIWTLNMLTADIKDQLEFLRHVKALGMSVEFVELGSEFYLEGSELMVKTFPTAGDYAKEANRWRDSIKKYFPDTKCAYVGCFTKGNKPNRRNTWNDGVAAAMKNPDAITLHIYPPQSKPSATPEQKGDPVEVLSEPFRSMDQIEKKDLKQYASVPEVWITEYNMNNNTAPVQGTWMHGLWVTLMSMKFLEEPKINRATYYTMCGKAGYGAIFVNDKGFSIGGAGEFIAPPNPPSTTPFAFSAMGYTLSIFGEAVKGKSSAAPIRFDKVPQQQCGTDGYSYPAVYGWKFSGNGTTDLIVLNLSNKEVSIETSKICSAGSHYSESYAEAYTYVAKGNEMKTDDGSVQSELSLKPFSITRISGK